MRDRCPKLRGRPKNRQIADLAWPDRPALEHRRRPESYSRVSAVTTMAPKAPPSAALRRLQPHHTGMRFDRGRRYGRPEVTQPRASRGGRGPFICRVVAARLVSRRVMVDPGPDTAHRRAGGNRGPGPGRTNHSERHHASDARLPPAAGRAAYDIAPPPRGSRRSARGWIALDRRAHPPARDPRPPR